MNKIQKLNSFWNSFGIMACDVNTVPDKAELPYITYDVSSDSFNSSVYQTVSIWYRSTKWDEITQKEQEISDYITRGGIILKYDGGAMWIHKSTPWAQRMSEPGDSTIRRIILNVVIEFFD